ncbi:MAG: hypothetical protein AAGA00_10775 [Pseudomonadota bacterium]
MTNSNHVTIFTAATLLLLGAGAAHAGPQHNCDNYASFAVSDAFAAKNKGCGFKGSRWSTNFKKHHAWCSTQGVTMAMLTKEDRARKKSLNSCNATGGKPTAGQCNKYAQAAIQQQNTNLVKKCGYSGRRWQLKYAVHKNWCMGATKKAMASEQLARYAQLTKCLANKP